MLAVDRQEDGRHQGDQRLVGADVRGRLLAADVLLAGAERQDEAALAVAVLGLADEAARHLAEELFLAGDHAAVGSAESDGDAEALGFEGDDVGLGRGFDDAERDGLGDGDDQQRALLVGDVCDGCHVFDGAEEVWRLDEDAGGVVGDGGVERGEIDSAGRIDVADFALPGCPGAAWRCAGLRDTRDARCGRRRRRCGR